MSFPFHVRLAKEMGPEINTKEEAMKTLGIEKTEDESGFPVKVKSPRRKI